MIGHIKQKCCFIIMSNFVMIQYYEEILRIQQTNASFLQNDIYFVELGKVPLRLSHLFNSVRHIYNFLTTHPECIIQMTEQYFKFVVSVNGSCQICCLQLKALEMQKGCLLLKKKGFELRVKQQELKAVKQKYSNQSQALSRKFTQRKQLWQISSQHLNQVLQRQKSLQNQLNTKKAQCIQLAQSLRNKQDILMQIKMKEGAFIALDD